MTANQADYSIQMMSRTLGVSRNGFHAHHNRPPIARSIEDAALSERIAKIHEASKESRAQGGHGSGGAERCAGGGDLGPAKWKRARVPEIPVIYIRAVAVDKKLQGNGVGIALMIDALKKCAKISERVGAAAVILDVLDNDHFEKRWKFYQGLGFHHLNDPDNPKRVFISMSDIRTTLKV